MKNGIFPRMTLRTAAHRLRITTEEAREAEDAALVKIGLVLMAALESTPDLARDRQSAPLRGSPVQPRTGFNSLSRGN